jgi:methionyl-tRNA formyltransferase
MRIAVMMTDENIQGREILLQCHEAGIQIDLLIVEQSDRAEKEKEYLRNRFYQPPSAQEMICEWGIPEPKVVVSLNDQRAKRTLEDAETDLILLDGSTIIKHRIFSKARVGAINTHPGLLPEYRGVDSVRWAILHGNPVGATAHFIDKGIDTGAILVRREMEWGFGTEILPLRVVVMRFSVKLMIEAVKGLQDGSLEAQPQPSGGRKFSWMPDDDQRRVDAILKGDAQPTTSPSS